MSELSCALVAQGAKPGKCLTFLKDGSYALACKATLRRNSDGWSRAVAAVELSRPEDYLSIYQSGCNHRCLKCHSWYFTQRLEGEWLSTSKIANFTKKYEEKITVWEPRWRATMWHATDLCRHCGLCKLRGIRSSLCPGKLSPRQVIWSPQGWGPARNIVSFTGGDLTCKPEFYAEAAKKIKRECSGDIWVLIETNGYGLTRKNLEVLASGGVDSFWLDIKAYREEIYMWLCGAGNRTVLEAPAMIKDMGFTLEVLTLYIPGWVEEDEIRMVADLVAEVDRDTPFTILAFFPEYKLTNVRVPTIDEMLRAYRVTKEAGLKNVRLGNCGVFIQSEAELNRLLKKIGPGGLG